MPIEQKLERCAPGDARRCKANGQHSQCPYLANEGSIYCDRHASNQEKAAIVLDGQRNYNLTKWRARVNELADNTKVKSLREEVGIIRIMIENILNRCQDEYDLAMNTGKLSDLLMKAEKLVSSCHRLEAANGQLLDKSMALNFAAGIVDIIATEIGDAVMVEKISERIMVAFQAAMDPHNGTQITHPNEVKALGRVEQTQLDELLEMDDEM